MSKAALLCLLLIAVPAAAHEPQERGRSVSVSGHGEASARPDRAQLALGVEIARPELKAAEAEANRIVRAYLAEVVALGLRDEQVSTTGVSISPDYVWDEPSRSQRLTGYRVRREISLRVRDLDQLGELILRATRAGVNQVSPPVLESSRAAELGRQALAAAAEDARGKARLLAETLGVRLGPVRSLGASDADTPRPVLMKAMAVRAAADESGNAQMGLSPGEIRYGANVSAEFDLLAP